MIVMKFGGSSVADRAQIEKVLGIVQSRLDRKPVVVSSAHKGVTNKLIASAREAARGEYEPGTATARQREVAASLGCPADMLEPFYEEIEDLLRGISLVKELSPRSLDYISSFGERMSVRCLADFFSRNGLKAKAYDVWDLGFITDSNFGIARPLDDYPERMRKAFAELVPADIVPVVTGFVGKNESGEITTVGRNGSDLTATLVASAMGADEAQIWSDTDGVLTADPSMVKAARNIPEMHFEEAAELAYFGSRVLHPSTLLPAMSHDIPVRVLNTNRPEHPGTVISQHPTDKDKAITSIAYRERQFVLTITSTRMFGQAGFLADVFGVLGRHKVVIDMVTTSEVSVSMTTDDLGRLKSAVQELEQYGKCEIQPEKTIMVVVGKGLPASRGVGARVLNALAEAGINVEMLSYGMGSINFSMVLADEQVREAVPILHRALFEG